MQLHTFWVPVTISIGAPQAQPGPASAQVQWVKVDVPLTEPATTTSAAPPAIELPDFIPRKAMVDVKIGGHPRQVAAAVARALADIARGSMRVSMRAETAEKFRQQVPELQLKRDKARKVAGKRIPFKVVAA